MLAFAIIALVLILVLFVLVMAAPIGMGLSWFFTGALVFLTIDATLLIFVSAKEMMARKGKERVVAIVSMALYIVAVLLGLAFMTISIVYNVLTFHLASSLALLF